MNTKGGNGSITSKLYRSRDVILIVTIFVFSFALATRLDTFENVIAFVEQHEQWELDEFITGALILAAYLFVYSGIKTAESTKAKKQLDVANTELQTINEKLHVVGQLTRHDALNKLATISNNVYLAKLNLTEGNATQKKLDSIENATQQIAQIFNFARVYEQLGVEKLSTIDVSRCITEAATVLGLGNIELVNECQGLTVVADSLLTQVFYNLLHNSVIHGGKVTQVRIYPTNVDGILRIIYEDNGNGITENEKTKIFQESYGKCSGHGLYLIQKICEKYGWTIKETGQPTKGAQFTITTKKTTNKKEH
ncbi:MAG: HAMP domain-containing sensor histidine kinase [Candidatus Bathyarchaeia archaeon]|jgi:signal transduction histidine kinase